MNNIYSMNRPTEQNQEKSQTYTSALLNLFEQKGYQCEAITHEQDTIYVMKHELNQKRKPFEAKPKISIN